MTRKDETLNNDSAEKLNIETSEHLNSVLGLASINEHEQHEKHEHTDPDYTSDSSIGCDA